MNKTILSLCAMALAVSARAAEPQVVPEDVFAAINLRDMDTLTSMLKDEKEKTLAARTKGGITPLHYAAGIDNAEAVYRIIDAGVDVNLKTTENLTTPLHWASDKGASDSIRFLLKKGADVNAKAKNGYAPLHFLARSSNPEPAKYLIEAGADINARDNKANTPLHIASAFGNSTAVAFFLKTGADSTVKNSEGKTPRDMAKDEATSLAFGSVPSKPVQPATPPSTPKPQVAPPVGSADKVANGKSTTAKVDVVKVQIEKQRADDVSRDRLTIAEQYRRLLNDPNTVKLDNGSVYQGEMLKGKFHGFGVLCNPNRERYEGEWKQGMKNGVGTFTYPNEDSYAGSWKSDVPHGKGVFVFSNGGKVDGIWKNGSLVDGKGMYIATDGSKHHGAWRNNMLVSTSPWTEEDGRSINAAPVKTP